MDFKFFKNHINPSNPPKFIRRNEMAADHGSDKNDIVKVHGGNLTTESFENEGSVVIIHLPSRMAGICWICRMDYLIFLNHMNQ